MDLEPGRSDDARRSSGPHGKHSGERAKREAGAPEDKAQDNVTVPDSPFMERTGGVLDLACNARTAVHETAHIIVAAALDTATRDANRLLPMIRAAMNAHDAVPGRALADADGRSEEALSNATPEVVPSRIAKESKCRGRCPAAPAHRGDGRPAATR